MLYSTRAIKTYRPFESHPRYCGVSRFGQRCKTVSIRTHPTPSGRRVYPLSVCAGGGGNPERSSDSERGSSFPQFHLAMAFGVRQKEKKRKGKERKGNDRRKQEGREAGNGRRRRTQKKEKERKKEKAKSPRPKICQLRRARWVTWSKE